MFTERIALLESGSTNVSNNCVAMKKTQLFTLPSVSLSHSIEQNKLVFSFDESHQFRLNWFLSHSLSLSR